MSWLPHPTSTTALPDAAHAILFFAIGLALGYAHFATLRLNTRLYLQHAVAAAAGLQLLRLAVSVTALALCARAGALALLLAFAGLLAARTWLLRRQRRAVHGAS